MHFVKAKSILSASNGMNLYRGCQHGCIYCDARSLCYQMNHVFEDIEVKENAPALLEDALKRRRKPCMIGTGAMSDPYIPLEEKLKLTRGECMTVAEFYSGATGGQISRCVKSMARSIRFLAKPSREQWLRKLGLSFADHMIPAEEKEDLVLYISELKGYYEEAVQQYPRMLQSLLRHMEKGEELGPDFEAAFG